VICECGCGQQTRLWKNRFIRGHNGRDVGGHIARFWRFVDKSGDCWLWTRSCNKRGYGQFKAPDKIKLAHRVSWEISNGPIPEGHGVLHHCDNPPCVRPDHLFLGTDKDNVRDAIEKGRFVYLPVKFGEQHPGAKLTEEVVLQMRSLREIGWTYQAIADRYGLIKETAMCAIKRKTWKHI